MSHNSFSHETVVHVPFALSPLINQSQLPPNSRYKFESDTDTEVIAKLLHHMHEQHPDDSFRSLVEKSIQQLEGAFACAFKSRMFPGELVATRRGSPLLVGIRTPHGLDSDHIPVQYR